MLTHTEIRGHKGRHIHIQEIRIRLINDEGENQKYERRINDFKKEKKDRSDR